MDAKKQIEQILMEFAETITTLSKHPVCFGKHTLYRREVHIISLIGSSDGITSSELATFFGVTRGVIHKILLQLEKRDLIYKAKQPKNDKNISLHLTQTGEEVFTLHKQYHEGLSQDLHAFLDAKDPHIQHELVLFLQYALGMAKQHL